MEPVVVVGGHEVSSEEWDAYGLSHPKGTFFHQKAWGRVIQRVFGHSTVDLVALRGGRLAGILPLVSCRSLTGGKLLISQPYAVYGGPLGDDSHAEKALVEAAIARAELMGVKRLEMRYREDPGPELIGTDLYCTFARDLPDSPGDVLGLIPKKARAEVRKARDRHGLELTPGPWYVDDLHRFFMKNKQKLGSPGLPMRLFQTMQEEFGEGVVVHLLRHGREPLGAVMSFIYQGDLIAYYAGCEAGADRAYSASNFMYAALQEWGVENGMRRFDFCRSRRGSGSFQFKVHQGFEPRPLHYRYHLVRDRRKPWFNPSDGRTEILRHTWSRLPSWVASTCSSRLARYLP